VRKRRTVGKRLAPATAAPVCSGPMRSPREADLRRLFDRSPVGMYRSTAQGRFVYVNPALVRMLGYDDAEQLLAIDLPRDLYADPGERAPLVEHYLGQEIVDGVEVRWRTRQGAVRVIRIYGYPVRDELGDGFEATVVDVTAERRLEQRLVDAQRAESLGVLAGCVAHDFNNLLAAMMGSADVALRDLGPGTTRSAVQSVRTAAMRAAELTGQLLAFSGGGALAVEDVALGPVVDELIALMGAHLTGRADLVLDLAPALPAVRADAAQLRQVVMNLVTNARDALPAGRGRISIRADAVEHDGGVGDDDVLPAPPAGAYVALEISDDGCGIDESTRRRMFDPFFTTKRTGHGLGLAAVHGIVRGHGGGLRVRSRPGAGATFEVLWPAVAGAALQIGGAGARGTVMVVDDEELVRDVLCRMLEEIGYRTVGAPDGPTALDAVRNTGQHIDAVLLDLTMPGMGGRAVLSALHEVRPGLPVILCSGFDRDRAATTAAAGFLRKPFRFETLEAMLGKVLGGRL